jgi:hypothetical protein
MKNKQKTPFDESWYVRIPKNLWYRIIMFYKHLRYPKSIWYGGSISREDALCSVGKGWSKLINNLYDAKPKRVKVVQVKEKYGTLRFYTSYSVEWFEDLVSYYENYESARICEQCGKEGKTRFDRSWYLTLCDECDKIDRENRQKWVDENLKGK